MAEDVARGSYRYEPDIGLGRFSPISMELDLPRLEREAKAHFRMRAAEHALDEEDRRSKPKRIPRIKLSPEELNRRQVEYGKRWNKRVNEEIRVMRQKVKARYAAMGWT